MDFLYVLNESYLTHGCYSWTSALPHLQKTATCLSVFHAIQWSVGQITPSYPVDLKDLGRVIQNNSDYLNLPLD